MDDDSPYGRVTDPERYAVLHDAARSLIDDLAERFDVAVTELEPEAGHVPRPALSTTRVTPAGAGAPVVITLTGFPGLWVTFGARHEEGFPHCGCDACDEDPQDVLEDLLLKVGAVTLGGFQETRRGYAFTHADGSSSSGDDPGRAPRDPTSYAPWPVRRTAG